ncbi:MAG: photosynthetic complex assembly protein PuhC [Gammaproteobacteria bacterium]
MGSHHEQSVPRLPLLAMGGLVLLSLVSVAWLRWFADPAPEAGPPNPAVAARELRFEDVEGGSVRVLDAGSGELIQLLAPGEQGFVRATVRGLVRARRTRGIGDEIPFRLEQRANGQLLLIDPATGQEIDLWAFGASNARPFAGFLAPDAGAGGATPETGGAVALLNQQENNP